MLHITVIANEKKNQRKNTGWGGGEEMQRQGALGASGGRKEEERKGNEGGVRGWMALWKEERWNQEPIGGKNEKRTSLTHRVPDVRSLTPFLLSSAVCVTLFPFSRQSALRGRVGALAKNRGLKRKSNKTSSAFIICPPYIVCHLPPQTSRGRQKRAYTCKQQMRA